MTLKLLRLYYWQLTDKRSGDRLATGSTWAGDRKTLIQECINPAIAALSVEPESVWISIQRITSEVQV
jgi:hypothetical protein